MAHPTEDVVRVKSMSRGVPIHFVGKMARMKKESRERDRKKSTEARADYSLNWLVHTHMKLKTGRALPARRKQPTKPDSKKESGAVSSHER